MESLPGRAVRWTFDDGPITNTTFEHSFNADGTITWRILDGQYQGASACENPYAAERVNDRTWAISYRAASGDTLTVILDLDHQRAFGFASNNTSWYSVHGRFELIP